jgi:hypothetical protein
MASKVIGQVPTVDTNLRRAFERAVRDIYQAGLKSKISDYRAPIVQRSSALPGSSDNVQKKALSDAARALAQLWKVSPNSSR